MDGSTTLTVRLSPDLKERLDRLATRADRTKSYMAAKAIIDLVAREEEIIAGIKRGLVDVKAGRVIPHAKAAAMLRTKIKKMARSKR